MAYQVAQRSLRVHSGAPPALPAQRAAARRGAGHRGRCAPFAPGRGQPLAAIAASRYALGADGMGALRAPGRLRQPGRGLALRARRRWRGRCAPGRLRQPGIGLALRARRRWRGRCAPGRLHVPRERARCLSWWWGCRCRRLRALRAARDARCNAGFALLPRARVGGGLRHHHAQVCGGTLACYRSMCSVSRRGAPLQPERPTPRPGRPPAL